MFSGIVEETGSVRQIERRPGGLTLSIGAKVVLDGLNIGDSVAVNGTCLTAVTFDAEGFAVETTPETLRRTNLGDLVEGARVNLERSLAANGRVGGHFVQGHIDGTAEVAALTPDGEGLVVRFRAPAALMRYIVPKGYVALDGMSLTVVETGADWFTIAFILHTRAVTVVADYAPGRRVNLEVDILGKYVERIMAITGHGRAGER
ncbi:MAG: riboflavin synthase [Ardenticatenaceae bacterium]|nr:riboflavin synthase [Ardenticatenaceae bacterium]HBY98264.1 riboflavin synthase [Chloroflexota bacterium]